MSNKSEVRTKEIIATVLFVIRMSEILYLSLAFIMLYARFVSNYFLVQFALIARKPFKILYRS